MADGSASVARMISVLNFFVEHPKEGFTVAQAVRSLRLNRSTCTAIMSELAAAGYLYRNADRSFVLGPAILTIARKVRSGLGPHDVARQEMRSLADELDIVVASYVREGDGIASQERAASASHLSLAYPAHMRHPLHPWGILFFLPMQDAEIAAELGRAVPPLDQARQLEELQVIAFARRHGFVFAVRDGAPAPRPGDLGYGRFMTALRPEALYALQFLAAPVFGEDGTVAFELVLWGFRGDVSGASIADIGSRLTAACDRVTSFIALGR
jgi:DNA-binding IclR family transcriptional regulator